MLGETKQTWIMHSRVNENRKIYSHAPIWLRADLDYFPDERDTNCVGQLEQRLCTVEGLMSKQRSRKLTMHSSQRPRGVLLTTAVVLLPPLKPWNSAPPEFLRLSSVTSRCRNPAVTRLHLHVIVSWCVFHVLVSPCQLDKDRLMSIYCTRWLQRVWLMTERGFNYVYWTDARNKCDDCSSEA